MSEYHQEESCLRIEQNRDSDASIRAHRLSDLMSLHALFHMYSFGYSCETLYVTFQTDMNVEDLTAPLLTI